MVLIGSLYASDSVHATHGPGRWVVIVTIYIFALGYCMTWAVGIKLFACEIQPIATRATATSLAQAANSITNFFVAFITPVLLAKSNSGIYFLFGGASALTLGVCTLYMPETKGHSLEAIGEAFRTHRIKDMTVVRVAVKLRSRFRGARTGRATGGVSSLASCGTSGDGGLELRDMGNTSQSERQI